MAAKTKKARKSPPKMSSVAGDDALAKTPPAYAEAPDMPVDVAIREWRQLASVARTLGADLVKIGLAKDRITTLAALADGLDARERAWQKARPAKGKLPKLRSEAESLKRKLLAAGEWALREDDEALAELARIREGTGLLDTLADLRDLGAFWKAHAGAVAHTRLRAGDLGRAPELADELAALADEEQSSTDAAQALELRNRCFWAGDAAAKEIRKAGRYAFCDRPKLAARFASRYQTDKRRSGAVRRRAEPSAPARAGSAGPDGPSAAPS